MGSWRFTNDPPAPSGDLTSMSEPEKKNHWSFLASLLGAKSDDNGSKEEPVAETPAEENTDKPVKEDKPAAPKAG